MAKNHTFMSWGAAVIFAGLMFLPAAAFAGEAPVRLAHLVPGMAPLKNINRPVATLSGKFVPPPRAPAGRPASYFLGLVDRLDTKSRQSMALKKRETAAPASSLFGETRYSIRDKRHAIFREVQEILFGGKAYNYAGQLERQKTKIKELKEEILDLSKELKVAFGSGSALARIRKDGLKKYVDSAKTNIPKHAKNRDIVVNSIIDRFKAFEIHLKYDDIINLMKRIDTTDLIYTFDILNLIYKFNDVLRNDIKRNKNKNDVIRKYHRIHISMSDVFISTQRTYISNIRDHYIPRVQKIIEKAGQDIQNVKRALRVESGKKPDDTLQKDLRSNLLIKNTAILYAIFLNGKMARILSSKRRLESNLKRAYSSLKTGGTGLDLIGVIDRSQKALLVFARGQAPVAVPFADDLMRDMFADLTIKMRSMN